MAKAAYIGVNGTARKVKKMFVGVPTRIGALKYLDHIESSGTQYIDTGYKATSENYRIKCKFTVITNTANTVLFGGGSSSDIISVLITADSQLKFYVGDGSVSDALSPFESGVEYEMECHASNGTLTVNLNGVSRSGSYSGTINKDYPLFIFANIASGSANQMSDIRVSEFQIYDNDILVRDFVPCENSDGEIGLYGKVNGQFYGNAGTGVFTAGSVVEEIGGTLTSIARKVKKAWIGVNGVARLFFGGGELSYYGTATPLSVVKTAMAAATIGDYALFGGGDDSSSSSSVSKVVDAYDKALTHTIPTALSDTKSNLSATTIGDYALFGGGYKASGYVSVVDAYNRTLTHSTPTAMSVARDYYGATTIGDYALFGGGRTTNSTSKATVDAYNTALTRSTPTALSTASYPVKATTVGSYAIFASGNDTDVNAYDASLTRTVATELSSAASTSRVAVTVGNYAVFAGGYYNGEWVALVDAYDTSLTHSNPTALTTPMRTAAATTLGDYALIGGGFAKGSVYSSTVYAYDTSLTLSTTTDLSLGRDNLSATTLGDYALFGGGRRSSSAYSAVVDVYTVS